MKKINMSRKISRITDRSIRRRIRGLAVAIILVLLFMYIQESDNINAQVPSPHGISGTIYKGDGTTQMPTGTDFLVNDSTSGDYVKDKTNVPVPGYSGRYSVSIDGSDGDMILVYSWNDTQFGSVNRTLLGDMTGVDVFINRTRPPEPNVSITVPEDNSGYSLSDNLNINGTFILIGGSGSASCNTTLKISNTAVFSFTGTDTAYRDLGSLSLGDVVNISYNITAVGVGTANFTLEGRCRESYLNFQHTDKDRAINITSSSAGGVPLITLVLPENNSQNISTNNISFTYYVSHGLNLDNCTLNINGEINKTQYLPTRNSNNTIWARIDNNRYNWSVSCTDINKAAGISGEYNFSVLAYPPNITSIRIDDPLYLETGANKTIICNATITDMNGASDISRINATLYNPGFSTVYSQDDANNHYTNNSCNIIQQSSYEINASCGFSVAYYAYNGSWNCTVMAYDDENHKSILSKKTTMAELIAIGADSYLDLGTLEPGTISAEKNITIINLGNIPIDVSVSGFGRVEGDNLSMVCVSGDSINIEYERYSVFSGINYGSMSRLYSNITLIPDLSLYKRTSAELGNSTNITYWRIQAPTGISVSSCNGTTSFFASI